MKFLYSDKKTGKTAGMDLDAEKAAYLYSKKIGDEIDGTILGLTGYKLKITGGSDSSGFALEPSIGGQLKIRVMRQRSKKDSKRLSRRITVRGNVISNDTNQVSAAIVEYGSKPLSELFVEKPKAEAEAKK